MADIYEHRDASNIVIRSTKFFGNTLIDQERVQWEKKV